MEFLKDFGQKSALDESFYFTDYRKLSKGIYGAPDITHGGSLLKIADITNILKENNKQTDKCLSDSNEQPSSVRLVIKTNSPQIAIKAHLKREWAHQNILLFNASGFDVYQYINGQYVHCTVISPEEPNNIFVHSIAIKPDAIVVIFFPTFNKVCDLQIGVKNGYDLIPVADFYKCKKPILFYGNSCTQGASASRSGNAYPNIVSRKMDIDVFNYSFSGACKAEISMAKEIVKHDISAMVIDYQHNASSLSEFCGRYEKFYKFIRQYKPDIPIILVGALNSPVFENHIKKVFRQIKKEYGHTFYINLSELFEGLDNFALSADNIHYTDVGMFRVADKIVEYLNQSI